MCTSPQTVIAAESWDCNETSCTYSNTEEALDLKTGGTTTETNPGSSSTSSLIPIPEVGMEFPSKEDAFIFYSRYAYSLGFGASRNGGSSKDGKTTRETITCHKGGTTRGKSDKPVSERRRAVKKTGCLARIVLLFNTEKEVWYIHKFHDEHNHVLCPDYSYKLTSHRNLPYYVKKLLEINEHAGLPVIGNINAVIQMGGGEELCGYSERDARNYIGKVRRYNLRKGDADILMTYFCEKQAVDPNFFYQCKFDDDNRLELVFWADSVSRAAYQYFGDALSFDATYLVNNQFVKQFESSLARHRRTEIDLDFQCIDGDPKCFTQEPVEDQFAGAYTHKQFYKFQAQLLAVIGLKFNPCERLGVRRVYTISEKKMGKIMEYKVDYNSEDDTYLCDCHLFQTTGLVCRHALLVYKQEDVEFAPSTYILDRWSKHCKRNHLDAKSVSLRVNEKRETYNNLYSLLHGVFLDLVDYALLDEATLKAVVDGMNGLRISLSNSRENTGEAVGSTGSNGGMAEIGSSVVVVDGESNEAAIKDPVKRRKRGRHPTKRLKPKEELIRDKMRKKNKKLTEVEGNATGGGLCSGGKRSK
ncbi:hypothetical protein LUZ63_013620 [Rhynchospora breviuscula]|uniref:SWIM-type domain-containing protein n=1 Tax=Rhynchospora breviuscula TaxID=2022672 RepID=A0A9Q0C936_9POAL|nr:hypothetical protein LUZ63_013620 [Rhynchospora breviuscula]